MELKVNLKDSDRDPATPPEVMIKMEAREPVVDHTNSFPTKSTFSFIQPKSFISELIDTGGCEMREVSSPPEKMSMAQPSREKIPTGDARNFRH